MILSQSKEKRVVERTWFCNPSGAMVCAHLQRTPQGKQAKISDTEIGAPEWVGIIRGTTEMGFGKQRQLC
jgi:hypothetical protein